MYPCGNGLSRFAAPPRACRRLPVLTSTAPQIFRREHFFRGRDNEDQLLKIVKVVGTDELERYLTTYRLYLQAYSDDLLQR